MSRRRFPSCSLAIVAAVLVSASARAALDDAEVEQLTSLEYPDPLDFPTGGSVSRAPAEPSSASADEASSQTTDGLRRIRSRDAGDVIRQPDVLAPSGSVYTATGANAFLPEDAYPPGVSSEYHDHVKLAESAGLVSGDPLSDDERRQAEEGRGLLAFIHKSSPLPGFYRPGHSPHGTGRHRTARRYHRSALAPDAAWRRQQFVVGRTGEALRSSPAAVRRLVEANLPRCVGQTVGATPGAWSDDWGEQRSLLEADESRPMRLVYCRDEGLKLQALRRRPPPMDAAGAAEAKERRRVFREAASGSGEARREKQQSQMWLDEDDSSLSEWGRRQSPRGSHQRKDTDSGKGSWFHDFGPSRAPLTWRGKLYQLFFPDAAGLRPMAAEPHDPAIGGDSGHFGGAMHHDGTVVGTRWLGRARRQKFGGVSSQPPVSSGAWRHSPDADFRTAPPTGDEVGLRVELAAGDDCPADPSRRLTAAIVFRCEHSSTRQRRTMAKLLQRMRVRRGVQVELDNSDDDDVDEELSVNKEATDVEDVGKRLLVDSLIGEPRSRRAAFDPPWLSGVVPTPTGATQAVRSARPAASYPNPPDWQMRTLHWVPRDLQWRCRTEVTLHVPELCGLDGGQSNVDALPDHEEVEGEDLAAAFD